MQKAIGLVETKGLLALIEATDAMVKAASVEIVKRVDIGGAWSRPSSAVMLAAFVQPSKRCIRSRASR